MIDTALTADTLDISVAGREGLQISLAEPAAQSVTVTVWKDRCEAVPVGAAADAWFSAYLGIACRLVRMTDQLVRPVNPDEETVDSGLPVFDVYYTNDDDASRQLGRGFTAGSQPAPADTGAHAALSP